MDLTALEILRLVQKFSTGFLRFGQRRDSIQHMNLVTIIFIALALAMDAFAVSIASGITIKNLRIKHAFTMAAWFGSFQAIMPLIGWAAGIKMRAWICGIDHWIAFGLLFFVGAKMIYESLQIAAVEEKSNPLDVYVLFVLSIATSIDALAAGLSFAILEVPIMAPVVIIGLITFCCSFAGVWIGDKSGHFFEKKIEIAGGLILIGIGIKILISHLLES